MTATLARADRITLLREVAEGPQTALFAGERRCRDDVQLVAVKVLRRRRGREIEQLGRLRELGRRLDRIGHRNVVAMTEIAVVEGQPALLTPWIDGIDLLDWVEVLRETDAALPTRPVCEILKCASAAFDAALNRTAWGEAEPLGLQHRDVKPSNVMIARDGEVKLVDFGCGMSSLGGRDARATVMKAGLGRYLSPGRRQGKRGSPASDVYSLGLIGVELFGGRWLQRVRDTNPAHDRHLAEVVANIPDLGLRAPADDRTLRSLLLRMVAFDPEARPPAAEVAQTMRTLADRAPGPSLEAFAHDHAIPAFVPPEPSDVVIEGSVVDPDDLTGLVGPEEDPEDQAPLVASLPPTYAPFDDDEDDLDELDGILTVPIARSANAWAEEARTEIVRGDDGAYDSGYAAVEDLHGDATTPMPNAAWDDPPTPHPTRAPQRAAPSAPPPAAPDARDADREDRTATYALPVVAAGAVGVGGLLVALGVGIVVGGALVVLVVAI